jgi:membrane-associated protease RseP (regulator of RpoE activity)
VFLVAESPTDVNLFFLFLRLVDSSFAFLLKLFLSPLQRFSTYFCPPSWCFFFLHLLFHSAKGGRTQRIKILPAGTGYVLEGDAIVRAEIEELLSYYRATEIKAGWGRLKKVCAIPAAPMADAAAAAAAAAAEPEPEPEPVVEQPAEPQYAEEPPQAEPEPEIGWWKRGKVKLSVDLITDELDVC